MTRHPRRTGAVALTLASALASLIVLAPPAHAGDDDNEIRREGSCTAGTEWKVKAKTDDGRIEFEGEVDSNVNGQSWNWKMKHNGTVSASGTGTTQPPSGSFEAERKLTNLSGTDLLVFKAKNPATGERCRGAISFSA